MTGTGTGSGSRRDCPQGRSSWNSTPGLETGASMAGTGRTTRYNSGVSWMMAITVPDSITGTSGGRGMTGITGSIPDARVFERLPGEMPVATLLLMHSTINTGIRAYRIFIAVFSLIRFGKAY
jgi:hypothetical protein